MSCSDFVFKGGAFFNSISVFDTQNEGGQNAPLLLSTMLCISAVSALYHNAIAD